MTIQQIVATKSQLIIMTKTAEPTVGMRLELSYVEGEWHDLFVHSYDEDGNAWFIDVELGPDGNINKDEDLNLFF
jgi:hypothetical protein